MSRIVALAISDNSSPGICVAGQVASGHHFASVFGGLPSETRTPPPAAGDLPAR